MSRLRAAVPLLALLLVAALPSVASAATDAPAAAFRNCGDRSQGPTQCARVHVPLDRTGAVPGDVQLAVRRLQLGQRRVKHRREAVLFLAGGPGQATTPLLSDVAQELKPLLKRRDLVTVDTRGTGLSSDLIVCPELEAVTDTFDTDPSLVASCARRLGGAAGAYATSDVVSDLDAVRQATGYDRLLIVGVSYGTYTAQRYAAAYPQRVSGLVLDSPVDVTGKDPFALATYRAVPRVLAQACEHRACRGVTRDPRGDLTRTLARMPITAKVDNGRGRRVTTIVRDDIVASLVLAGDFDRLLRASLPSALRRAAQGDGAPLARLARESGLIQLPDDDQDPSAISGAAGALSTGSYVATICRDTRFPWSDATPLGAPRLDAARQALTGTTPQQRGGFGVDGIVGEWPVSICGDWPTAPDPAAATPLTLPAVPTLILNGRDDARTPGEVARTIAARAPKAALVTVPGQGHSVLSAERGCVTRAVRTFAAGKPDTRCVGTPKPPAAAPLPPESARGLGRTPVARAKAVAHAAILDAVRTLILRVSQDLDSGVLDGSDPEATVRVAGLRSGSARLTKTGVDLDRIGYVPDTAVTGTLGEARTARIRVRGRGLRAGTYRLRNPLVDSDELMSELGLDSDITIELQARVRQAIRRVTGY